MIPRRLEIAASARVLAARRTAALEQVGAGALLGREERTLRHLAEDCAAETGEPRAADLDELALERLVGHVARGTRRWSERIRQRPGLARALSATLRDLRDAGVTPAQLRPAAPDLAELLDRLEAALERLAGDGHLDRIGLFRRARRGARAWLERLGIESIEVHGATELVGSAGDLIETLAEAVPLRYFQPDWGSRYGEALRADWPWRFPPEPVEVVARPHLAPGAPVAEDDAALWLAPSRRAELEAAADEALARLGAGARPDAIWIVARNLDLYASWIEPVFGARGIPYQSSLSEPLARTPAARAWIDLLRALSSNLERGAVLQLVRGARTRFDAVRPALARSEANWLAHRAAVLRGVDDWRSALDDHARLAASDRRDHDPRDDEPLRALVEGLEKARERLARAKTLAGAARALLRAGRELLRPPAPEAREADEAMRRALGAAAALDAVDRAGGSAPTEEDLATTLLALLESPKERRAAGADGGVHIVDALQARGVPTPHLLLIGLEQGRWPRERREDPLLPSERRTELRRASRRPVPGGEIADLEDPFLFGLLLSQAEHPLWLSRAERDPDGRELLPSPLLRNLPFVAPQTSLLERERALPAGELPRHPGPGDALVHAALATREGQGDARFVDLVARVRPAEREALAAGVRFVRATEADDPDDPAFDPAIDGAIPREWLRLPEWKSPSFIDGLGRCPLRQLFQSLLGVEEPDTRPPWSLERRESGQMLHAVLERVYPRLWKSGKLAPGTTLDAALEFARSALPDLVEEATADLRTALRERHPRVWHAFGRQLERAVEDVLRRDLEDLIRRAPTSLDTEQRVEATLEPGGLQVRGKLDRIVHASDGIAIADWKSRRSVAELTSRTQIARGHALQIAVYVLAVAAALDREDVSGQAISAPLRPERPSRQDRRSKPLSAAEAADLAGPALEALAELLERGRFPFREDAGNCRSCPYTLACRKGHAASARRIELVPEHRAYFELQERSK